MMDVSLAKAVLVGLFVPAVASGAALVAGRVDFALGAACGGAVGVGSFVGLVAIVGRMFGRKRLTLALAIWGAKLGIIGVILCVAMIWGKAHPAGVALGIVALPASAAAFFHLGRERR